MKDIGDIWCQGDGANKTVNLKDKQNMPEITEALNEKIRSAIENFTEIDICKHARGGYFEDIIYHS